MARNSEVLIQGTTVPGGRITVTVPVDHTFSADFARNTYPYPGAQYIWVRSWGDEESTSSNTRSNSTSSSGGSVVGGLIVVGLIIGGFSLFSNNDSTPDVTPTPSSVEYVQPTSFTPITQPNYTEAETDSCKIWADANPTLAAKLTPGDRCFQF